jgi:adenine-specific DNA-methyltransferase
MLGSWQKKNTARLQWNTKPRRTVNPKDVEFQTAEVVIPFLVFRLKKPT